jgi:hypothetical protein
VIKVFKLLLPIYAYNSVYNSTYNSYLYLLLRSPPLASILVFLSLPLLLLLLLPFPLTLLLLPYISGSLYSSLLCALCSTTFSKFCTLLGDLVFGKSLGQLYLLKGLNSNIRDKEEIGEEVLTFLIGD